MKKRILYAFAAIGATIAVCYIVFFSPADLYRHFQGRQTNAEREVFKQSVTYNEGMLDDLAKYQYEYMQSDETEKKAIASLVRSRFANFDKSKIENIDLLRFLEDCGV